MRRRLPRPRGRPRDEGRDRFPSGLARVARGRDDRQRQAAQVRPRADGARAGFSRLQQRDRARRHRVRLWRRRDGAARGPRALALRHSDPWSEPRTAWLPDLGDDRPIRRGHGRRACRALHDRGARAARRPPGPSGEGDRARACVERRRRRARQTGSLDKRRRAGRRRAAHRLLGGRPHRRDRDGQHRLRLLGGWAAHPSRLARHHPGPHRAPSFVRQRGRVRSRSGAGARDPGRAVGPLARRPGRARPPRGRPHHGPSRGDGRAVRSHRACAALRGAPARKDPQGAWNMTLDTAAAVGAIAAKTKRRPKIGVILGSGLGGLAKDVQDATRISYGDIPGFRRSTAPGHAGELVVGTFSGKDVAVMNGRVHYYEGYDIVEIGFPVRVFRAWGVRTMIITNACGGLNPAFKAGDLMVLSDHINFMGVNPLRGPNDDSLGPRFPDMVGTYTDGLRKLAHSVDGDLREGIYVAVAGPNFETPAELRMLRGFGADAVGMSTVPEVLVARHMGMDILAISTVTDMATGIPGQIEHVTHEAVLEVANRAGDRLADVIKGVIAKI